MAGGNEGRVQVDGLNVGAAFNGAASGASWTPRVRRTQFTLSGGLGEADGGINLNIVPKTGGNRFAGQFFTSAAGSWSQSDNIDDSLRAYGITQNGLVKNWDVNGSVGGPFKKDRLWFYANVRDFGTHSIVPGAYPNLNAGDATKWTYVPDTSTTVRTPRRELLDRSPDAGDCPEQVGLLRPSASARERRREGRRRLVPRPGEPMGGARRPSPRLNRTGSARTAARSAYFRARGHRPSPASFSSKPGFRAT
jgi:hypothetical protein